MSNKVAILLALAIMVPGAALASVAVDLTLTQAAKSQDWEAVHALLNASVDVNAREADGATALAWAVHWDHAQTVEKLIDAGADVNLANDYGVTPLSLACSNRNAQMVQRLLEAGADANAALWSGETVLMTCARTGNVTAVESLLKSGANADRQEPRRGQTALMWAISFGQPDVARVLIEQGADIHLRSHRFEGFTPMLMVGYAGDVEVTSQGGFTALSFAARVGDLASARLLLSKGADVDADTYQYGSPLVMASAEGHEELALMLLEAGADPNRDDANGLTALHYSMREGLKVLHGMYEADVEVLRPGVAIKTDRYGSGKAASVKKKGRLRPSDIGSTTPKKKSDILPGGNMPTLMAALLERGADPNIRALRPPPRLRLKRKPLLSLAGATPFFLAAASGDVSAMEMLADVQGDGVTGTIVDQKEFYKEGHADDNQIQGNGTPLMVAAGLGRARPMDLMAQEQAVESVKTLVELGADINEATQTGWTALHAAAYIGADSVIQYLVDQGAHVDVKNGCGQTPLSLAAGTDARGLLERVMVRESSAELLREMGAGKGPFIGPVGRCVEGRYGLDYATVKTEDSEEN